VLLSGNHADIEAWRRAQSEKRTRERRPDLLEKQENGIRSRPGAGAPARSATGKAAQRIA
jgi:tRNA (guanine37-N1)-methyltransferase